ncbi:MAG: transporter [Cypionkella sp.]|uniref:hypothetical protein n=1 Tax=Cypionkella sp. TaxID=2811411 RepID=UPI0026036395|nr:hypothetical protein [Cypionkella sp.]MDB5659962.1 transporter [Cypionkella sp.]
MLVLHESIANIALSTVQNELGISAANLPWVINSYILAFTLAFGGLLLLGGRLATCSVGAPDADRNGDLHAGLAVRGTASLVGTSRHATAP